MKYFEIPMNEIQCDKLVAMSKTVDMEIQSDEDAEEFFSFAMDKMLASFAMYEALRNSNAAILASICAYPGIDEEVREQLHKWIAENNKALAKAEGN